MQRCERCKSLASKSGANVRGDARAAKSSENAWRTGEGFGTPLRTTGARWTRRPRCGRELARTEWGARRASRAAAFSEALRGHNGVARRVSGGSSFSLEPRERSQFLNGVNGLFERVFARADAPSAAGDLLGLWDRTAASRGESVVQQRRAALGAHTRPGGLVAYCS